MLDIRELIESVLIAGVLAFFIITFVVQSFVVQGHSMEPTLSNGERLFVNKFIYNFRNPKRGEVIVLDPKGGLSPFIKRVIGLPGEELEILDGNLYIDNEKIEEDYIAEEIRGDFGPYEVPEGKIFAMGDNRNYSSDSRNEDLVGYVDYDSILGKSFWLYWPITEMRLIESAKY